MTPAGGAPLRGIYSLPNELLYTIFESLPTRTILAIAPVSRRFHALCVRVLHNRLSLAASLADRVLYIEIYRPEASLSPPGWFCAPLGTPGLQTALDSPDDAGKIGRFGSLYSRFRPQRVEPKKKQTRRPGDIPGSRTHPATENAESSDQTGGAEGEHLGTTVSLDAEESLAQLCAVANLVKTQHGGAISSVVHVCDGTIRVWSNWLKEQTVVGTSGGQSMDPAADKSILWVNNGHNAVGVRCAVKQRERRQDDPIAAQINEEVAVTYHLDFRDFHIRTSRLLFAIEEAFNLDSNFSGNTMIVTA